MRIINILKQYLRLGIRKLIGLKDNALRSPFAILQPHLEPTNHRREHHLNLMTGKPPPRTRMSTSAKLHFRLRYRRQLVPLLVFRR